MLKFSRVDRGPVWSSKRGNYVRDYILRAIIGPVFVWFGSPAQRKPFALNMHKSVVFGGLGRFVWIGWVVNGKEA